MNRGEAHEQGLLGLFQQAREKLALLCNDPKFRQCLKSALAESQLDKFQAALRRLEQNDIFIGSLGVQGVGKSTLLNALLFGRRILPVDVTETTAVLTKIYSADGDGERAEVIFSDGRSKAIPLNQDSLREYAHNEHNPGNKKKVDELRCFVHSRILTRGICLVDTPGVASLSKDIGRVTLEFLPQLSASLFITMTAPCLTATEMGFLRSAWDYCDRFFFVQNVWGESRKDIEDATNDIRSKLSIVSQETGKIIEPVIYRIDIHQAMEGMANDRKEEIEQSGLTVLVKDLDEYVNSGVVKIRLELFQAALQSFIAKAAKTIGLRKAALDKESRRSDQEFREEEKQFKKRIDQAEDRWRQEERNFVDKVRDATRIAEDGVRESLEDLRERMVADIESRKMNAEHISKSFDQRIRLALRQPAENWEREVREALEDLQAALSRELTAVREEFEDRFGAGSHARLDGEGAKHWEFGEGLGGFIKGAGWLGVTLLAGEVVLSWLGLAAASSAAFGPAGWIVSGGLLLGGLLLKKWCENKAVAELHRAVTDAVRTVRRDVLSKLREAESGLLDFAGEVRRALVEEVNQLLWQLDQMRQDRSRSESERQQIKQELLECEGHLKKTKSDAVEVISSCLKN